MDYGTSLETRVFWLFSLCTVDILGEADRTSRGETLTVFRIYSVHVAKPRKVLYVPVCKARAKAVSINLWSRALLDRVLF